MSSLPLQLKSAAEFVKAQFPAAGAASASAATSASSASICRRTASNRGHYQYAVSLAKLVLIAAEEADVFLVHVDIYEAPNLPGIIPQVFADRREALLDFPEQFGQRPRIAFDRLDSVGKPAQRCWDLDSNFHFDSSFLTPKTYEKCSFGLWVGALAPT